MASLGLAIRDGLRMWEADKFEDDQRALARMKMKVEQLGYEDALSEEAMLARKTERDAQRRVMQNRAVVEQNQNKIMASPAGFVETLNSLPGTRAEGQRWVTDSTSYGSNAVVKLVDADGNVLQQGTIPSGNQALYSLSQYLRTSVEAMKDVKGTIEQQAKFQHDLNKIDRLGGWGIEEEKVKGAFGLEKEKLSGRNALNVKALEGFNALNLEGAKGQTELAKTLITQSSNLMDKALINSLYHNNMYIDKQTGEFKKADGSNITSEDMTKFNQTLLLSQQALAQGITSGNLIDSFPRMMANVGIAAANAAAPQAPTSEEERTQAEFDALVNRLKVSTRVGMAPSHTPYVQPGGYTNFFDNLMPAGTGTDVPFGFGGFR